MLTIGIDMGSSSIKVAVFDTESELCLASTLSPKQEMPMNSPQTGWAEQDPSMWWEEMKKALAEAIEATHFSAKDVKAIGVSYQMHGLVLLDKNLQPLRPAIIWCDSRAIDFGEMALHELGSDYCFGHLLNMPANFTAAKLAWVKKNEVETFERAAYAMLPGDYLIARMTGTPTTTVSGLSEGIFWDFSQKRLSKELMTYYGFPQELIPPLVPTFGEQGLLSPTAAEELGLSPHVPITYRAGDQPNNAFSLNVLRAGEMAATGGTSGVVYGVSEERQYDALSRINTFAHVNYSPNKPIYGVLLCINGTGILNSWVKRNLTGSETSYEEMNRLAAEVPAGAEGLSLLPFGNGTERILRNRPSSAQLEGLQFSVHDRRHIMRAAQEGIVFAFYYGMQIMKTVGITPSVIRAGAANLFLSPLFRETLATLSGASIELYNTNGALGAARGAAVGAGAYQNVTEAFSSLAVVEQVHPNPSQYEAVQEAYLRWVALCEKQK